MNRIGRVTIPTLEAFVAHLFSSRHQLVCSLKFSKKQNMIKKNYQLNRNEKFVDKAQQCFAFLHIKPKFKFAVQ